MRECDVCATLAEARWVACGSSEDKIAMVILGALGGGSKDCSVDAQRPNMVSLQARAGPSCRAGRSLSSEVRAPLCLLRAFFESGVHTTAGVFSQDSVSGGNV